MVERSALRGARSRRQLFLLLGLAVCAALLVALVALPGLGTPPRVPRLA